MTGRQLKQRMFDLDLTNVEMARIMCVHKVNISRWRTERARVPRYIPAFLDTIEALREAEAKIAKGFFSGDSRTNLAAEKHCGHLN